MSLHVIHLKPGIIILLLLAKYTKDSINAASGCCATLIEHSVSGVNNFRISKFKTLKLNGTPGLRVYRDIYSVLYFILSHVHRQVGAHPPPWKISLTAVSNRGQSATELVIL